MISSVGDWGMRPLRNVVNIERQLLAPKQQALIGGDR